MCLYCFTEASKLFLRHLFASTFVSRTVSSTDNKYNKQNNFENKTFTFIQLSPLVQLGQKLVHGLPRQSLAHKSSKTESWVKMKRETPKIFPTDPSTPPTPPGSSCQVFTSSPPPCWLAGWQRVGGPPSLYPLIPSPSPVLHPVHSHSSHLIPPIHQNCLK